MATKPASIIPAMTGVESFRPAVPAAMWLRPARALLERWSPVQGDDGSADIVRANSRGSRMICLAALLNSTAVGVLMVLDIIVGWDAIPLRLVAEAALLANSGIALALRRHRRPQRCADLELARLERAAEGAIAANLTKSRYLANVSHEIRSPLNAIYGYAQLVERDGANAQEAARVIQRCTEHVTSLVEGLLDISQLENGTLRLRVEAVPLDVFIDRIVSMVRPAAAAKGLELVYDAPAYLPAFVRMDQGRLQQLLINLLSNAIKFTERGRVTLRLRYAGQIATFDIIDTGPGIAPQDRERIFEAFEQANGGESGGQAGIGLGLTISRAIADILGGRLELVDGAGPGACFRVTMMLGETGEPYLPQPRPQAVLGDCGSGSVLVVDDDPEQLVLLERILGSLGLSVVAVGSGAAALDRIAGATFDLAILDIGLGDMSGWEVAARLREKAGPAVKIMILTADAHELHRPSLRNPPHDYFLLKPFGFDILTRAVATLLPLSLPSAADHDAATGGPAGAEEARMPEEALVHIARIRELLRIGYIRGIEAEIRQLEERVPEAAGLVERLYGCLDRFDLAAMQRALERG
jgi:signal transduction histidine kinase/CheY-like chemotaxis protein